MADTVNPQITDSVTQANVKVLGDAPAVAMGNLYQATAQALANAAHNATTTQQQTNITAQAATTMGVSTLYSLDTAAEGKATAAVLTSGSLGVEHLNSLIDSLTKARDAMVAALATDDSGDSQ